jgi:putative ABC transport system permease protein
VAWAVNLYRGQAQAQLANGTYQGVILMGLDDASLTGAPTHMLVGKIGDLQIADAILVDEAGFQQMWPGEPLHVGKVLEMNQRRTVVVGVYRASQTFMTMPIIYTRFSQAMLFVPPPPTGRLMPFVLAKAQPGINPEELARRIEAQTGLKALTNTGFTQHPDPGASRRQHRLRRGGGTGDAVRHLGAARGRCWPSFCPGRCCC